MKEIYANLANKRLEFIKAVFLMLLLCNAKRISHFLTSCLANRYSDLSIDYMMRFFSLAEIFLLTSLLAIRLSRFLKKNLESMLLLGLSNGQILLQFLWSTVDVLLLQVLLGSLIAEYYGRGIGQSCLSNFMSAAAIFSASMLLYQIIQMHQNGILLVMAAMAAVGIPAFGTFSYQNMYAIIMSERADGWYRSLYLDITVIKLLLTASLIAAAVIVYIKRGFQEPAKRHQKRNADRLGDFIHKSGRLAASRKNYFWMYRSLDFIFWKLCSSFLLLICCWLIEHNAAILFVTYGICLVTSFYLRDVYEFERGNQFIYYMSSYSYKNLLTDHIINGVMLCQDSIFPILLVRCIMRPESFSVLLAALVLNTAVSFFLNVYFYAKYPQKQSIGSLFVIAVSMHIPFLNMIMLCKSYHQGRNRWNQA